MTGDNDTHFVFLAALGWDSVIAGRTRRLAEAVAQMGNRCTFVELPSLRRTLGRLLRPGCVETDVRVASLLPDPLKLGLWRQYAARKLRRIAGSQRTCVVATTPLWAPLIEKIRTDVLCYDCNDNLSVHSAGSNSGRMRAMHDRLVSACDVITTVSETLVEQLRRECGRAPVHLIPNGVYQRWIDAKPTPIDKSRLGRGDRSIVGFIGSLYEWIDFDLLAICAEAIPEVDFVVAGPERRGVSLRQIESLENLRLFGPVAFEDVPSWIAAFDVCVVPFKRDRINTAADPLKIYEYCALGKSVVSTCAPGAGAAGAPISMAGSYEKFIEEIRRALDKDPSELRNERIDFARANTWTRRGAEFLAAIGGER